LKKNGSVQANIQDQVCFTCAACRLYSYIQTPIQQQADFTATFKLYSAACRLYSYIQTPIQQQADYSATFKLYSAACRLYSYKQTPIQQQADFPVSDPGLRRAGWWR